VAYQVRDGWVYLGGNQARAEDVFALAQKVAELPGVRRVIVTEATGR
jgi:hypothetical protein